MLVKKSPTFSFYHEFPKFPTHVPVVKSLIKNGVIILGFANGDLRIYRQCDQKLLIHIDSGRDAMVSAMATSHDMIGGGDVLFAAFVDGMIAKYELSTGLLISCRQLEFQCKGFDTEFDLDNGITKALIAWGRSQQVVILDWYSLDILVQINAYLASWPLCSTLFDDQILLISRSGQVNQTRIGYDKKKERDANIVKRFDMKNSLTEPADETGLSHSVDLVISVLRLSIDMWIVVQRHAWTAFKWENNELSREIGISVTKPLVLAFKMTDEAFGLVAGDGSLFLVVRNQMIPVDPVWKGSVIDIAFSEEKIWATVEASGVVYLYCALFNASKPEQTNWSDKALCLEEDSPKTMIMTRVLTLDGKNYICTINDKVMELYLEIPSWLKKEPEAEYILSSPEESFTVLDLFSLDQDFIYTGTSLGRILVFQIREGTLSLFSSLPVFASPVVQFFRPNEDFPKSLKNLIVASSKNSTSAVIDANTGLMEQQIPGYVLPITKIHFLTSESDYGEHANESSSNPKTIQEDVLDDDSKTKSKMIIILEYGDGESRAWDLETKRELTELESLHTSSTYYECNAHRRPSDKSLSFPHGQKTFAAIVARLDKLKNHKDTKDLSMKLLTGKVGIVSFDVVSSLFSTAFVNTDEVPSLFVSGLMACQLLIGYIIGEDDNELHDISAYLELIKLDEILSCITLEPSGGSKAHAASKRLLFEYLTREYELRPNSLQREVDDFWLAKLPNKKVNSIASARSIQAVLIVSSVCRILLSKKDKESHALFNRYAELTAESLMFCFNMDDQKGVLGISAEIIGKDWDMWQKFLNILVIVDTLIEVLYNGGFTKMDKSNLTNRQRWSRNVSICILCVQNIAYHNVTLLISTLVTRVDDESKGLETRITALRLLTLLMTMNDTQKLIGPSFLSTMMTPVVKCLDHGEASIREKPELSSASLLLEATNFLSVVLHRYKDYMAFHKAQQKLVIALIPTEAAPHYRGLLGLCYDLRTGSLAASLGINYSMVPERKVFDTYSTISGVLPGSVCHQMEFSPDGKHLAAVIENMSNWDPEATSCLNHVEVIICVWKISFSFMSMFRSLTVRHTSSIYDAGTSRNAESAGTVLYPSKMVQASVHATGYFKFKWVSDDTISVTGDQDFKDVKFTIE